MATYSSRTASSSVVDPDPHGSGTFPGIRIIVPDPDPGKMKEDIIKNCISNTGLCVL